MVQPRPGEQPQHQAAAQVHHQDPEGEIRADPRLEGTVDQVAQYRPAPAGHDQAEDDHRARLPPEPSPKLPRASGSGMGSRPGGSSRPRAASMPSAEAATPTTSEAPM